MKQVVLDTSFILSCIRKKIDFFDLIPQMGISILIPTPVIKEIEKITNHPKNNFFFKEEARLALKLLEKNKFKKMGLDGKNVDFGIIKIARENSDYIIATLDKEIKNKVKNQKLVIRGEKRLEIVS
jgi:rRNA-processing protein FCF1